jgi:hypothetical protein
MRIVLAYLAVKVRAVIVLLGLPRLGRTFSLRSGFPGALYLKPRAPLEAITIRARQ